MAIDTQEMKIRKGQALNLAVNDAVANGKQNDGLYIYQQFLYYFELASLLQSSDLELIHEVLNKSSFTAALAALKTAME